MIKVGQNISHYQVLKKLGAGGMGVVYQAKDTRLGRQVALKFLPPEMTDDNLAVERFRREARTASALNHPHICTIYDIDEHEGHPFIAMELLQGHTLKQYGNGKPLEKDEIVDLALQIADALKAAHSHGIIHRDVKPANIFVTERKEAKILDFGLAKLAAKRGTDGKEFTSFMSIADDSETRLTRPGTHPGTIAYMSPEQVRGEELDARTDLFSFGAVLYELATGTIPFHRQTAGATFDAILNHSPVPPRERNPRIGQGLDAVIQKALEKDREFRYQTAAEIKADLGRLKRESESAQAGLLTSLPAERSGTRLWLYSGGALLLVLLILGAVSWSEWTDKSPPPPRSEWVQLTNFSDSVTSPALSPDGRMLAFIRGPGTFTSTGQIYVKMLSEGEAVQLTNDPQLKMGPVFSPDGSRIAYTVPWDTWEVPLLGGEPRLLLPNASGLTWLDSRRVLFSEVKTGLHMAIVTSDENRAKARDVYVPEDETLMAHRSYLSPDGNWVLIVEMETAPIVWRPCRLVPFDASSQGRQVGPLNSHCTEAAWSHDGRWMYFTADVGTGSHIWRQSFPDGKPEQITFGPTQEEGLAVSPDDGSLITAVGMQQGTVWVRDANGERQISGEGDSTLSFGGNSFSPDGKTLYYLKQRTSGVALEISAEQNRVKELWAANLETGQLEKVLAGFDIDRYDLTADGDSVIFITQDEDQLTLWMAPLDRRSAPQQLLSSESLRGGVRVVGRHIYYREAEDDFTVYRLDLESRQTQRIEIDPSRRESSREGLWIPFVVRSLDQSSLATLAFFVNEGSVVLICQGVCVVRQGLSGDYIYLSFYGEGNAGMEKTFVIPVPADKTLPDLPPSGVRSETEAEALPGTFTISPGGVAPGPSPSLYAFTRTVVHRNLYRIPVPR